MRQQSGPRQQSCLGGEQCEVVPGCDTTGQVAAVAQATVPVGVLSLIALVRAARGTSA